MTTHSEHPYMGFMPPASLSDDHKGRDEDESGRPVLGVLTNWRL